MASNYTCFSCKKSVPADSVRYPPVRATILAPMAGTDAVLNIWISMACPCGSEIGLFRDFRLIPGGVVDPTSVRGIMCTRRVYKPRQTSSGRKYGPTISVWEASVIDNAHKKVFESMGSVLNSTMYDNLAGMVARGEHDPDLFKFMHPVIADDLDIQQMVLHFEKMREYSTYFGSSESDPWNFARRLARIVCILMPGLKDKIIEALDEASKSYWSDKGVRYVDTTEMKRRLKKRGVLK